MKRPTNADVSVLVGRFTFNGINQITSSRFVPNWHEYQRVLDQLTIQGRAFHRQLASVK
ncbi:hypothetical protein ACFP1H_02695 [Secundilactobacillus hailunensis]|uniref:Uncharacterized protein n=1 Tax=Secundilactobacillus hailunensis TaxID=2559923 RepID=A0ABW1T646_9LACO|nr:hypothetical protein [Secundilactobacillus hailunensis]